MACKVGDLLEADAPMSTEDQDTLVESLALTVDVPATALAKALTLEGHPVGSTTIKDHRAGRCACARKAG